MAPHTCFRPRCSLTPDTALHDASGHLLVSHYYRQNPGPHNHEQLTAALAIPTPALVSIWILRGARASACDWRCRRSARRLPCSHLPIIQVAVAGGGRAPD